MAGSWSPDNKRGQGGTSRSSKVPDMESFASDLAAQSTQLGLQSSKQGGHRLPSALDRFLVRSKYSWKVKASIVYMLPAAMTFGDGFYNRHSSMVGA